MSSSKAKGKGILLSFLQALSRNQGKLVYTYHKRILITQEHNQVPIFMNGVFTYKIFMFVYVLLNLFQNY